MSINFVLFFLKMSSLATNLASKSITEKSYNIDNDEEINKIYKVNVFRLNYCDYEESSKLSTKTVFGQWFVQEAYTNENNEVMGKAVLV